MTPASAVKAWTRLARVSQGAPKFRPHKRRDPAACPLTTTIPSSQAQLPLPLRCPLLPARAPSRVLHSLLRGSLHIVPGYGPPPQDLVHHLQLLDGGRGLSTPRFHFHCPIYIPVEFSSLSVIISPPSLSTPHGRRFCRPYPQLSRVLYKFSALIKSRGPQHVAAPDRQKVSSIRKSSSASTGFRSQRQHRTGATPERSRSTKITPGMAGYGGCQLWARGMLLTSEWRPKDGAFNNGDFFHSMVDLLKNPDNTCAVEINYNLRVAHQACIQGVHTVRLLFRCCASTPDRRSDFGPARSSFWNGDGVGVSVIKILWPYSSILQSRLLSGSIIE
ncbi:hypothetical protein C8J57DRAFT_1505352 [Mycena rebaudengoi]|nr:hypothetical protein C8J57DRAFT_1505352 [Mycena rebaudengoi]